MTWLIVVVKSCWNKMVIEKDSIVSRVQVSGTNVQCLLNMNVLGINMQLP